MSNTTAYWFSLSILICVAIAQQRPTADLGYVKYIGISNATLGVNSFLGVRYAEAPVDDLRWRAPVPVELNSPVVASGYTNATEYPFQCVQATPGYMPITINHSLSSEDCLFMNIHTPLTPVSNSLPVVVNIHGGGYITGNATSEDGTQLVSRSQGTIIYISIQYRLGAYGFLAGSAVRADGALNAGLLDQRLALEWVQKHVGAFGGDPWQVTIEGGSAGGGSVTYQLMKGGGESDPPFRAAIPQFVGFIPHHNTTTQDAVFATVLNAANCTSLKCLRSLPFETLANATQRSYLDGYNAGLSSHGDYYHSPVVDGSFVVDLPSRSLATGKFTKVPIFNTVDEFEGIGFTNGSIRTETEVRRDIGLLWPAATPDFLTKALSFYPLSSYGAAFKAANNLFQSPYFPLINAFTSSLGFNLSSNINAIYQNQAIWGDYVIHCPSRSIASAAFHSKVPIWKTRFNAGFYVHSAVDYYFRRPEGAAAAAAAVVFNDTLAEIMMEYYISFVIHRDPNVGFDTRKRRIQPWWPQYGVGKNVLWVNETLIAIVADVDAGEKCDFFAANAEVVRN